MAASAPAIDSELPRLTGCGGIREAIPDGQHGIKFQNWAQTFQCAPELFFRPQSTAEIQRVSSTIFH